MKTIEIDLYDYILLGGLIENLDLSTTSYDFIGHRKKNITSIVLKKKDMCDIIFSNETKTNVHISWVITSVDVTLDDKYKIKQKNHERFN